MLFRTVIVLLILPVAALGQLDFEKEPVNYSQRTPTDRVQRLSERLSSGSLTLKWDERSGYLKSLLTELEVPVSSQGLVFSKTSLQVSRISPRTPRAIYFNDDVYVGWVQHGDMIELSASDPTLGGTFYTLTQSKSETPIIKRETSRCLQCHGSTHTRRIPGHIVRSVYPDRSGQPVFRMGTHIARPGSPFDERFGGWYVTGNHGESRHMGNAWVLDADEQEALDVSRSSNVNELSSFFDPTPYLTSHSDIVALLVLQHQVHVHNVLTAANHSGMLTERDAAVMNKALERSADYVSDSTERRYKSAADKVTRAILQCDVIPFESEVSGTSTFRDDFESRGPFDTQHRTLRQIDGTTRLFRYPCSFLIYSESFRQLHPGVLQLVLEKLSAILTASDEQVPDEYRHLSSRDRADILAILLDTGVIHE